MILYSRLLSDRRFLPLVLFLSLLLVAGLLGNESPDVVAVSTSNGDGTGSGTGTTIGTPVPLAETFKTALKGDYVAAGVGMRGTGPPGGGTIVLPALPGGATVQNAFLYWAVMNDTTIPSLADGNINGNPITGSLIGKTGNPCWSGDIHNYVADVTSYALPGANNVLTDFASGGTLTDQPLLEGASLVVIYSDLASPSKTIIIHEGAISFILPPPESTTFTGFSAVAGTSQTTYIVADGQQGPGLGLNNRTHVDGTETANHTLNGAGPGTEYWDTLTQNISAFIPPSDTDVTIEVESASDFGVADCITWVAQVLSVPAPEPQIAVGGVVQLRTGAGTLVPQSATSGHGYALPLATAVAGAMITLAAGAWYARRRWLR